MTVMKSMAPQTHSACDSPTNSLTNVQTWERQTIQLQSVQHCPDHHHKIVPKLHDSFGETADADLGESARNMIRVDADTASNVMDMGGRLSVDVK